MFPFSTFISVRAAHLENVPKPMFLTELGIVILVRAKQSAKAHPPISVTELGIVRFSRAEQLKYL